MKVNDPRALSFIIFQKIQQELAGQDEEDELTPRRAREIILDALKLLPEITVRPGPRDDLVVVRSLAENPSPDTQEKQPEFLFNLQEFVDSLRTVWQDYRAQLNRDEPRKGTNA